MFDTVKSANKNHRVKRITSNCKGSRNKGIICRCIIFLLINVLNSCLNLKIFCCQLDENIQSKYSVIQFSLWWFAFADLTVCTCNVQQAPITQRIDKKYLKLVGKFSRGQNFVSHKLKNFAWIKFRLLSFVFPRGFPRK